jgi:hypothetical protein
MFGGASDLTQALGVYAQVSSGGFTYYDQALSKIDGVIRTLAGANPDRAPIVVLFLSDGQPNDIGWEDMNINRVLTSRVAGLRTLAASYGSQLSFSTLYFGAFENLAAVDHLKVMAAEGGGRFLNTNLTDGARFEISDVVTIPGVSCGPI